MLWLKVQRAGKTRRHKLPRVQRSTNGHGRAHKWLLPASGLVGLAMTCCWREAWQNLWDELVGYSWQAKTINVQYFISCKDKEKERCEMSTWNRTPATGQGELPLSEAASKAGLCLLPVASACPWVYSNLLGAKTGRKHTRCYCSPRTVKRKKSWTCWRSPCGPPLLPLHLDKMQVLQWCQSPVEFCTISQEVQALTWDLQIES
jgi:hypothetical protein